MKKIIPGVSTILIVFAIPAILFAATAGPMEAGSAVAVQGDVQATTPPEKKPHLLKKGDKIYMGDKLETGADGQLQVLLLDNTVFTLGASSAITVDEFVYDPENEKNKDNVNAVKGALRVVSGKVSKKNLESHPGDPGPEDFGKEQEDALELAELLSKAEGSKKK